MQHQLGWEWFRQEPWRFPLGRIVNYGYPFGTFIAYTDSIPLLAFIFKILSPFLGQDFQYFGLWGLLCVIGQMLVGLLILREFTSSYMISVLGASLLVFSPPMIFRSFVHDPLLAHWIILAGIWFVILEYKNKLWQGSWLILFGVSVINSSIFCSHARPFMADQLILQIPRGQAEDGKWSWISFW